MIDFRKIDHILLTIPVGETPTARRFYADTLGLAEVPGPHPHNALWFSIADIQLHIREEDGANLSARHPAFVVQNLNEAQQFLRQNDIDISYSAEIDGRSRCFFRDPFGNRFELLEYV